MKKIEIREAAVYGKTLFYPVCEDAKKFSRLTGKQTFSHSDLCLIESLGFEIVNVTKLSYAK